MASNDAYAVAEPIPPAESASHLPPALPPVLPAESAPSPYAAAHEELARLQAKRARGWMSLILLVGSVVAFGGLGAWQWSWKTALLIGAILFVHELGHYVAMRAFGYRDLRMFFIPLLGAAVSGQNRNVPGWKKAIVSLAGPVPGIVLGTVVGIIAAWQGQDAIVLGAIATIALNALNLMPFPPLDGGWVLNSVLFCRNRWAEAAFKLLAACAGFGASAAGLGKLWMYLGIAMLVTIPGLLMEGKVVALLRARGWLPASGNVDALAGEQADQIFAAYDEVTKGKLTPKTLASGSLSAFEKLNARPPGWLASTALLFTYGGALVIAVVGIAFCSMYLAGSSIFGDEDPEPVAAAAPEVQPAPQTDTTFSPASTRHFQPAAQPGQPRSWIVTLVMNFPAEAAAVSAFEALQANSPAAQISQFGTTIAIATDPENRELVQEIETTLVASGGVPVGDRERGDASFDLQCTAPNDESAAGIANALDLYFSLPQAIRPSPPWVNGEWRESTRRAAATYLLARDTRAKAAVQEPLSAEQRKWRLRAAVSIVAPEQGAAALREMARLRHAADLQAIEKLSAGAELDPDVLEQILLEPQLLLGANAAEDFEAMPKWEAEMRAVISQDEPPSSSGRTQALASASHQGSTLILTDFNDIASPDTLALIARYLEQKGCRDFRYGVRSDEDSME